MFDWGFKPEPIGFVTALGCDLGELQLFGKVSIAGGLMDVFACVAMRCK